MSIFPDGSLCAEVAEEEMGGQKPQYSKKQVDAAGATLVAALSSESDLDEAYTVINNWRSSHSVPLNIFRRTLRQNAEKRDSNCLVAQRIKRLSSIELKLRIFTTMKLGQMQDIGGCRAVVNGVDTVNDLMRLYRGSKTGSTLDHIDDYIANPKKSGYRGVHLIYRYHSSKNELYNGLKIEIQLRSKLQHAWATAVETVGTFVRQALKSSMGEQEWLRFFALMGSAIALREHTPMVPNTPENPQDLISELRDYVQRLDIVTRLRAYGTALLTLNQPGATVDAKYFLLELDPVAKQLSVTGFKANELDRASKQYLAAERSVNRQPGADAVLVSVDSLASLRRAYPNYFLDTSLFVDALLEAIVD